MFEQVVRPSQKPQTGARRIISVREIVEVKLNRDGYQSGVRWGKPGTLPTAIEVPPEEDPLGINFVVKKDKEYVLDYAASTTQKVRVENPDDPSQYVVAERLKKAVFKDQEPQSYAVYRVNPDGKTADLERTVVRDEFGWTIETVQPSPGWTWEKSVSNPSHPEFTPVTHPTSGYNINWPAGAGQTIVSEKGPDG